MKYTITKNGIDKTITIPDKDIDNYVDRLEISQEEAIEMWLVDNDYCENAEQNELDGKAKSVKINHSARAKEPRTSAKPRTVKVSDEKVNLFNCILQNLIRCEDVEREDVTVLTENKLIQVNINGTIFKVDIIQQRKKK